MRDRFRVRLCPEHGLVEQHSEGRCLVGIGPTNDWCGRVLSEPFEVVRLEGAGQARTTDPQTAKAAGGITVNRGSQRWRVLEALHAAGEHGATSHELEDATGIRYASLTPRIGELKHAGLIVATERTRPGRYGVDQEVLVVSDRPGGYADTDEVEPESNADALSDDQLEALF